MLGEPAVLALPARLFWDPATLKQAPGVVLSDNRPGAPEAHVFWASNLEEAGQVLHGYQSAWLPASLLEPEAHTRLADALFAASRHWHVSLHVNKGLAGAPAAARKAATETARIRRSSTRLPCLSVVPTAHRRIRAFPVMSRTWPPLVSTPKPSRQPCILFMSCSKSLHPILRSPISSMVGGRSRSGVLAMPGCLPSRIPMIRRGCFLFTTGSGVSGGAPTGSPG